MIDFEIFRPELDAAVPRSDGSKGGRPGFFFQWRAKYGGCEVVTIPNFIFRKDYGSYCVPLLPLDMAEKFIVEKIGKKQSSAG